MPSPFSYHKFGPQLRRGMRYKNLKIGLLGGSFNPAHQGHLDLSLTALRQLKLDQIWWLVSPQNPLKSTKDMASFETRLSFAQNFIKHPKIFTTDIEQKLNTRFTADTLVKLQKNFPKTTFTWLMGADNLMQIPQWERWTQIFKTARIAIFPRKPWLVNSLNNKAAQKYARNRLSNSAIRGLAAAPTPKWALIPMQLNPLSATDIRKKRVKQLMAQQKIKIKKIT